jgi:hypothetical protein
MGDCKVGSGAKTWVRVVKQISRHRTKRTLVIGLAQTATSFADGDSPVTATRPPTGKPQVREANALRLVGP